MSHMWKKHTIGKRIIALCLLITMLFDTVAVSAMASDGEDGTQIEILEKGEETEVTEELETLDTQRNVDTVGEEDTENSILVETEEVGEVLVSNQVEEAGVFENVEIVSSFFQVKVLKGIFNASDEEASYRFYVASYNSNDERLLSSYIGSSTGSRTFDGSDGWNDFAKGTEYVRIEAYLSSVLTEPVACSEKIYNITEPEFSLVVNDVRTETGRAYLTLSYTGDFAITTGYGWMLEYYDDIRLSCGVSEDESTWIASKWDGFYVTDLNSSNKRIYIGNLEGGTTYYSKIFYEYEVYDDIKKSYYTNFEQTIYLEPFTTKVNNSYILKNIFPDAVFRNYIIEQLRDGSLTEDSEVTVSQLEKITRISYSRYDSTKEAISNITGVELLPNLTSIELYNNEISSIDKIDWSIFKDLSGLYLGGNNITKLPDWGDPSFYADLRENMLQGDDIEKLKYNADTWDLSRQVYTQRGAVVELELEETYYVYGEDVPIVVNLKGEKFYTPKIFIDNVESVFTQNNSIGGIGEITISNSSLEKGQHTIKVELYDGERKVRESQEYRFNVVEENAFIKNGHRYMYCSQDSSYSFTIYFSERKSVQTIKVTDDNGTVFAQTTGIPSSYTQRTDPRHELSWTALPQAYVHYYRDINLKTDYDMIPSGEYNIQVGYSDGTIEVVENCITVVDKDEAFYDKFGRADIYKSASDEYYIRLYGHNIEPEKFEYYEGNIPLTYCASKKVGDGYEVKLKGELQYGAYSQNIRITPKDGYEVVGNFELPSYTYGLYSGMLYYEEYNSFIGKLVLGVNSKYQNQQVTIEVRDKYSYSSTATIATGTGKVTDELIYMDLYNLDGTDFIPENDKSYYLNCIIGDESEDGGAFYVSSYNEPISKMFIALSELPITITIYKPYEIEPIKEIIITDKSQLKPDQYGNPCYYFEKNFIDSLVFPNCKYEVVLENAAGIISSQTGYLEYEEAEEWTYNVERTELDIYKYSENYADINVTGTFDIPVFSSSNPSVAEIVTYDSSSSGVTVWATIWAVSEGTAEINITADGITKSFTVTVISTDPNLQKVGEFKDLDIIFSGYNANRISGTFVPNTEERYELYMVSYNNLDEKMGSAYLMDTEGTFDFGTCYTFDAMIPEGASYVRVEAYVIQNGKIKKESVSEKFVRTVEPEFVIVADELSTSAGSLNVRLSYEGDLATVDDYELINFYVEFSYGTSEDESTWTTVETSSQVSEIRDYSVLLPYLEPETTYYGKIRIYDSRYDSLENKEYIIFEQSLLLPAFKTTESVSYNLQTEFPDAVFRKEVVTALNSLYANKAFTEESIVTNAQLEAITIVYLHRYDDTMESVRDLTGIELLTNMRFAQFPENEIDTVDNIDWSKLPYLNALYMAGNNITRLPNLTNNKELAFVDFNYNMLSKEELYTIYSKIPLTTTVDSTIYTTQRVEEIEDKVEWRYSISRTKYNLDKESEKTGMLQVYNALKNPTFKSSDTTIAKIAVSKNDPSIATITAVSEGIAEITVTVDGVSKWFLVKVYSSVPKVQAQSNVVINTFFGNEAKTALEITNSFETAVKKVTMTESVAGLSVEQIDGTWYLCSDGSVITKNTKVTLAFELEGYEAIGDLIIAPQTITVNGVNKRPVAVLSATEITFRAYPYTESRYVELYVEGNDYRNLVDVKPEDIVLTSAPSKVTEANAKVMVTYDKTSGKVSVSASDDAVNGTYKYTITPSVGADYAKDTKTVVLTVNLKATKPAFKFNTTNVSLDAAYPGETEGSIKLLMDEGYVLDVEGTSVLAPNDSVKDFIHVEKNTDGTITFRVIKAGLSTAGTYKITAKVKSEWDHTYELKETKVTVKVTNSSKVTLSSKSKSVTINPYVGYANVKANLAVKGFAAQDSVEYTTYYSYIPINELAKNATDMRLVFNQDGTISITGCSAYADGKYKYNLLGTIIGNDGTVTYTKPFAFTVQLKAKALTIVPTKKSVTVYADYCTTVVKEGTTYYKVEIPVSIKEDAGRILDMVLANSMETSGVSAKVEDSTLIVEFPTTVTKLDNVTFTSADISYTAFMASITVNSKEPKPAFTAKKITMNRYTDATVTNTVVDTEGYSVIGLKNIVIHKGKNVDATGWFSVNSTNGVINGSTISISIPQEHDADIVNGDYTVSLTPIIKIDENEKELPACTFTLKVAQPKVKLGIGNIKIVSQTVNLYPSIDENTSDKFVIKAYSDNEEVCVSEIAVTTKDKKLVTSYAVEENNAVSFTSVENAGKNIYVVTAKVKKANGVVEEKEVTLNKAFVVNIKELPTSIKLTKKKLTFSPYIEDKVSTIVNSPELVSFINTDKVTYRISAVETNSKYKELASELKNHILTVTGNTDGSIIVDNTGYVAKNTTFYYLVKVELMQKGKSEAVATYTDRLSVVVKNTLPKSALQLKSISLDNAFVGQETSNRVVLTTGSGLWTINELRSVDVVIKSGSKDVTKEGFFNVTYDGSRLTIGLNNKKADGTLITVPKGSYKFEIIPKVSERNGDKDATLAKLVLSVKVTSSRPTVKMASKVTVKAGQATQYIESILKNNGTLTEASICTCTKYPSKADETDVAGIEMKILENGTISVKAGGDVTAGSYTFAINPVTIIDGKEILLDAKKLTVVVKK